MKKFEFVLFRYLIAKRGLDFVMRHSQVRNFPDELAMRLGMGRTSDRCEPCRNVPHDPQITTAQIKTADLKRESDRLPEPTRPEEINQCFDNLLKTVQCKGMDLKINGVKLYDKFLSLVIYQIKKLLSNY